MRGVPSAALKPVRNVTKFEFRFLDVPICVECDDDDVVTIVRAKFGAFSTTATRAEAACYLIQRKGPGWLLLRDGQSAVETDDPAELLFCLEKDLCILLQRRRPDLLFLHAAALERNGKVFLLAGDSGHGKSTTAWGLLHYGFKYLSDELSPIELHSLSVLPYPQALCLKTAPPDTFPFPEDAVLDLGSTLQVPVVALPTGMTATPCRLAAVFFVRYDAALTHPRIRALGHAEAAARAYVAALNLLAHPARGIDAVIRLVSQVPCLSLQASELVATCEAVMDLADGMVEAENNLARNERFGESALRAAFDSPKAHRGKEGVRAEPVLRSLAAEVLHEMHDLGICRRVGDRNEHIGTTPFAFEFGHFIFQNQVLTPRLPSELANKAMVLMSILQAMREHDSRVARTAQLGEISLQFRECAGEVRVRKGSEADRKVGCIAKEVFRGKRRLFSALAGCAQDHPGHA